MLRTISKLAVPVACLILASSQPAFAQGGGGGRGGFGGFGPGGFDATIDSRQMERYGDLLGLSEEQRLTAAALFDAYQVEHAAATQAMRDKMEQMRDELRASGDREGFRQIGEMMQDFRRERQRSEDVFFTDVKSLLTPEQEAQWPRLERARRRETTVARGLMSGERVDLLKIVGELEVDAPAQETVAPVLDQYEIELDRALIERNKIYEDAMSKMRELMESGDMTAVEEMFTKGRDASMRVRDVNKSYARRVQSMLPADAQAAFETAYNRAAYPQVYQPTRGQRAFEVASGFSDLTPEQTDQVSQLRDRYDRDLAAANVTMRDAIVKNEETLTPDRMFRRGGGGGDDALDDARRARRELDAAAIEKLRGVLTEEQATRLREATSRDEDQQRGGADRQQRRPGGDREGRDPRRPAPDRRG